MYQAATEETPARDADLFDADSSDVRAGNDDDLEGHLQVYPRELAEIIPQLR